MSDSRPTSSGSFPRNPNGSNSPYAGSARGNDNYYRSSARERSNPNTDRDDQDKRLEMRRGGSGGANGRYDRDRGSYDKYQPQGEGFGDSSSRNTSQYRSSSDHRYNGRAQDNYRPRHDHRSAPTGPNANRQFAARERPTNGGYNNYSSPPSNQPATSSPALVPTFLQSQSQANPSTVDASPQNDPNGPRTINVTVHPDPDADHTKEELIHKYTKRLIALSKCRKLEDTPIIDSKWGVKPKGFEKVTAQRAKLSGLFPLPGHPRPVDFTKLEGVVKDRMNNEEDILNESSKIDPIDSRNATLLIVKGIDFERFDYLKITDYFNRFLTKVDTEETSLTNNIQSKKKTKDDRNLIIEFTNNTCATIACSLDGTELRAQEYIITKPELDEYIPEQYQQDYAQPHRLQKPKEVASDEIITLHIARPGEYVVQCLPPYNQIKHDEIEDKIIDNPRKITLKFSPEVEQAQLVSTLNEVAPIKGLQYLREHGTKDSLGIAFVEFYLDPKVYMKTIKALPVLDKIVSRLNELPIVSHASYSCLQVDSETGNRITSIQDCPIEFNTLLSLVRNEYVSTHPKSKVIQLLNIVTARDLVDDENFRFIQEDIKQEVAKFGTVKSIRIPRPANDYTPGIVQFSQPGLGKIYVEFDDEDVALKAIMGLAGRMYNDRTLLCAFYDFDDYKNGVL